MFIDSLELGLELVEAALAYYAYSDVSVIRCQPNKARCPSLTPAISLGLLIQYLEVGRPTHQLLAGDVLVELLHRHAQLLGHAIAQAEPVIPL